MMPSTAPWGQQTLRAFWQSVNWDNRPLAIAPQPQSAAPPGSSDGLLSLSLTVGEYFRNIPWSGIAPVAVVASPSAIDEEFSTEDAPTLDDFMSCF
jgi:hypothetical protein